MENEKVEYLINMINNIARKIKPKDEMNNAKNNRKKYDTRF